MSQLASLRTQLIAFARHARTRADAALYEVDGMPRPEDVEHIHRLIAARGWTELLGVSAAPAGGPQPLTAAGQPHVVEVDHLALDAVVEAQ